MLLVPRSVEHTIPVEIRDEVELWAREHGRHATITWNRHMNAPELVFTRMDTDPHKAVDEEQRILMTEPGEVRNPRTNRMMPASVGVNIWAMGPSGVRKWLDEHNLWGAGSKSMQERIDEVREQHKANRKAKYDAAEEAMRDEADLRARTILGIPYLPVGIDLKESEK